VPPQLRPDIGLNSISFLAADVVLLLSIATPSRQSSASNTLLSTRRGRALDQEIQRLIHEHVDDLTSGFIAESQRSLSA